MTQPKTSTADDENNNNKTRTYNVRIPHTLQAVFLASNRGRDVHKPPPERVASKTFFRNWFFPKQRPQKSTPKKEEKSPSERQKQQQVVPRPSPSVRPSAIAVTSPHVYLDAMIRSRGYSTKRFKTLLSAYYNKPTALQQASYDVHLVNLVRADNGDELDRLLKAGLSPNPCNKYGESLIHMLCRRGDTGLLKVMLQNGASLQVADDFGRTPLHDAFWAGAVKPAFGVVELILDTDPRLLHMMDSRGAVPLSYARQEHAVAWMGFFEAHKDVYWPVRDVAAAEEEPKAPPLTDLQPHSRPIPDPPNALTLELAKLVASGRMEPEEAHLLKYDKDGEASQGTDDDDSMSSSDEYDSDEDSSSSYYDSDDDDDDDDDSSFDEDEMQAILTNLASLNAAATTKPVTWSSGTAAARSSAH